MTSSGTAAHSISATRRQENDTLTEIGEVTTDGDSITRANIYNVTRLGNFREFEEHVENPSAHIEKVADKNSLGLSSVRNIPASISNYKVGFTNGIRDWQGIFGSASWTQTGQQLMFASYGAGQSAVIGLAHSQKQADYTLRGRLRPTAPLITAGG